MDVNQLTTGSDSDQNMDDAMIADRSTGTGLDAISRNKTASNQTLWGSYNGFHTK